MTQLSARQEKVTRAIDAAAETILDLSHQIHACPELGEQEVFASGLFRQVLSAAGFEVEAGFAGLPTAFRARKGRRGGPVVAFLCEYDALPGLGHACGHNVIGATSLAAGLGLATALEDLPGEVWVVGTPAEETRGAKVEMARQKIFANVDAAMMIHGHEGNYKSTIALAVIPMEVTFTGRPSHAAASPWEAINAYDAMHLLFSGINAMRQQLRPDARVHGFIREAGVAPNIIPDRAVGRFNVRALSTVYCKELQARFLDIVQGAALMTGAKYEIDYFAPAYEEMRNNHLLANRVADYAVNALGEAPFGESPDSFGSIDMANVSRQCPGIHMMIGITAGQHVPIHTPEFREAAISPYADQEILRIGKALALTGLDVISDADFRGAVKAEFLNA